MEHTLGIWGTSTTWGAWDKKLGGWAARLGLKLNSDYYMIYALGVCGDTTKGMLQRFDAEAQIREPTQIIFSVGTNDFVVDDKGKQWVSPAQFVENFDLLIRKAKKYTKQIALIGIGNFDDTKTQPVPWHTEAFYSNKEGEKYDKLIQHIARKNNVAYIPLDLDKKKDFADGIHPNEQGHEKITKTVLAFLKKNKWVT